MVHRNHFPGFALFLGLLFLIFGVLLGKAENFTFFGRYDFNGSLNTPEIKEYLQEMGYDSATQNKIMTDPVQFFFSLEEEDNVTEIDFNGFGWGYSAKSLPFEDGKEFEYVRLDGKKIKTTVTLNEDEKKMTILMKMPDFDAIGTAVFNKTFGCDLSLKAKTKEVKLQFEYSELD